jgi:signal transduction histidine kinase
MKSILDHVDEIKQLFEFVPTALMLINAADGTIISVNPAARRLFNLGDLDVYRKTTIDLGIWSQPQDRSRLMHLLMLEGQFKDEKVDMLELCGRPLEILMSVTSLKLSGVACFLSCFKDITLREELMDRLHSVQTRLESSLGGVQSDSWRLSENRSTLFFSAHAHLILDPISVLKPDTGIELSALMHSQDVNAFLKAVDSTDSEQKMLNLSVRLRAGGGHYRWFQLWSIAPHMQGGIEDIHEQKILEIAKSRDSQKAALATSAANMGTFEVFPDGTSVWDPQMYRLYGYESGTALLPHQIFEKVQTTEGYERTSRWLAKSLKHGLSLVIEFEIRWPDGQMRWLGSQGGYMDASQLSQPSLMGVAWDVTDQRKARIALQSYQQDLSRLTLQLLEQEKETGKKLALALHDQLGQTLTAARLLVDSQLNTPPTDAGKRVALLISQAMHQIRSLLMDLRPPMLEENGLGPALQSEIDRALTTGASCDITLDLDQFEMRWPPDVEYAFFMIAREAISNAISHSKADLIQVILHSQGEGLVMNVIDDGQGFNIESRSGRAGHLGLVGMRERATAVDARLSFSSLAGDGTRVQLMWAPAV